MPQRAGGDRGGGGNGVRAGMTEARAAVELEPHRRHQLDRLAVAQELQELARLAEGAGDNLDAERAGYQLDTGATGPAPLM